jgi:hypothetical protein
MRIRYTWKPHFHATGGYAIWSAHVASIGGDAPANNTAIQAAPPRGVDC